MTEVLSAASPPPRSHARTMVIYVAVLGGIFMSMFDMQVIGTALPTIAGELGDLHLFGWVSAAYLLAASAVTPFYGKLGDLFGRKKVFLVAVGTFAAGSILCASAWSMPALVAARLVQGLGGGGLMVIAFAVIGDLFEPRDRARYQGYSTAVFTVASILGPVAGGYLAETFGWRSVFLVNLPVAVTAALTIFFAMRPRPSRGPRPKIDWLGGLLLSGSATTLVLWADRVSTHGFGSVAAFVMPVGILVGFSAFLMVERRASEPIVPIGLFRNPTIALSTGLVTFQGMAGLGLMAFFPLFMQISLGMSPTMSGLMFLPGSFAVLASAIITGQIVSYTGRYKWFPVVGMMFGIAGMIGFLMISHGSSIWYVAGMMLVFSLSIGMSNQVIMLAVQTAAPKKDLGTVTGTLNMARNIGQSLGLALHGAMLAGVVAAGHDRLAAQGVANLPPDLFGLAPTAVHALPDPARGEVINVFDSAFDMVFTSGTALFCAAAVLAVFLPNILLPKRSDYL